MWKLRSSKVALFSLGASWAILGPASGDASAGDHHHQGTTFYSKVTQQGVIFSVPTTSVVSYGYYAPLTYPTVTYGAVLPAQPTPYLLVPTYATSGYAISPVVPPTQVGQNTASPLLKSASGLAMLAEPPQASENYLAEYTRFLQQEVDRNPATIYQGAGVRPHPSDLAALNANHSQLVGALGADRLASIGRFLNTKRADPNFRANAVKLFEPLLGVYLPQYVPVIDRFLEDLRQGATTGDRVPPAPSVPTPESGIPPAPPQTSSPSKPSLDLVKDPETGHFFATAPDGTRIEFDANRNPLSMTKPDGRVTRPDPNPPTEPR